VLAIYLVLHDIYVTIASQPLSKTHELMDSRMAANFLSSNLVEYPTDSETIYLKMFDLLNAFCSQVFASLITVSRATLCRIGRRFVL
jgi:hypothetical protein